MLSFYIDDLNALTRSDAIEIQERLVPDDQCMEELYHFARKRGRNASARSRLRKTGKDLKFELRSAFYGKAEGLTRCT